MSDATVTKGYLWANVKTVEDIQKAIDYYNLQVEHGDRPAISEIRIANRMGENVDLTLLESAVPAVFREDVPDGHIFFVMAAEEADDGDE